MKCLLYKICVCLGLFLLGSCEQTDIYKQGSKTSDSLIGAVGSMAIEFSKIDTLLLQKAVTRFSDYSNFIKQNINDTVSKNEAEDLQSFFESGKNLENFSKNRIFITARAGVINKQLSKLSEDIRNKNISTDEMKKYLDAEKEEAKKLIDAANAQVKIFYSGIEEFRNSLRGVEELMRNRNKGELPTIIKDTLSL